METSALGSLRWAMTNSGNEASQIATTPALMSITRKTAHSHSDLLQAECILNPRSPHANRTTSINEKRACSMSLARREIIPVLTAGIVIGILLSSICGWNGGGKAAFAEAGGEGRCPTLPPSPPTWTS